MPEMIDVQALAPYRLRLRFDDGAEGEVDVAQLVSFQGVFEPLREPAFFMTARLDKDLGTVVWPNGADLDPLVLHALVVANG